jgi:gliding motility-associated-like protein
MKKQLLLFISVLICFCFSNKVNAQVPKQLLPKNQPEQDACNALPLCGNSFSTPYSYQGTGKKIDLSGIPCDPANGEDNSMWMKLSVSTSGTIVFQIIPIDPLDDYDFAVLNTTNTTCNNLSLSDVVRADFNNNENGSNPTGIVGLNMTSNLNCVQGGTTGDPFVQYINAVAGETYLIMVNDFGHDANPGPSSGFTIDFTGSTATFNQTPPPAFGSIDQPTCNNSSAITLYLTTPALCSSIAADGSDFSVTPSLSISSASGLICNKTTGYTYQITIAFGAAFADSAYGLNAKIGSDKNTLLGLCNNGLVLPDAMPFKVPVAAHVAINKYICYNQLPYLWNGISVTAAGNPAATYTTTSSTGCDSVTVLNLTVSNSPLTNSITKILCPVSSYTLPWDSVVNTAGIYSHTYKNMEGCDSFISKITISITASVNRTVAVTLCGPQSYVLPWDSAVNKNGAYTHIYKSAAGCDSLISKILLSIDTPSVTKVSLTVCGPRSYILPWDSLVNKPGSYTHIYHNIFGCDSLFSTVSLTIDTPTTHTQTVKLCGAQSYNLPWDSLVNKSGTYTHYYKNTIGCDSIISQVFLTIYTPSVSNTSIIVCGPQSYVLPWDSSVNRTGTYFHIYKNTFGCDSLLSTIAFSIDTAKISDTSIVICAGYPYRLPWDSSINSTGIFTHAFHNIAGCDSLLSTYRVRVDVPANINQSMLLCGDSTETISAGNGYNTYAWNTGASSSSITITKGALYTAQATDGFGCIAKDTFQVKEDDLVSILPANMLLCVNDTKTVDAGKGFQSYLWSNHSTAQTTTINAPGIYWVTLSDTNHCRKTDTLAVVSSPLPEGFLPATVVKCFYNDITIQPTYAYDNYLWSTGETSYAITVMKPGIYNLQVTDNNGCAGRDSINVVDSACKQYFYIPNAFTPNGDGRNDVFKPGFEALVVEYSFIIYNRWGQKIFSSGNPTIGWDGTVNGQQQPSGTYVWVCNYQLSGMQPETQKGTVVLIR